MLLSGRIAVPGGIVVAYYRLYFLNERGSHIERFTAIDADTDSDAIRLADSYQGKNPMELWCGGRLIHRFEAPRPKPFRTRDSA